MSRRKKDDTPPLRMLIESGRLVPATPYDAERLDTFGNSKEVLCYITQERYNKLIAKFHAVLSKVIKSCPSPWADIDQAKEAIKLSLGKVKPHKTASGEWRHEPRSMTEMDDEELSHFFDDAMTLIERITGVDPLTLQAESASTEAPYHETQSEPEPMPVSDAGAASPVPEGDASAGGGDPTLPPGLPPLVLYAGHITRVLKTFIDEGLVASDPSGCKDEFARAFKAETAEGSALFDTDDAIRKTANTVTSLAMDVVDEKKTFDVFRMRVCELVNCRLEDLEKNE